MATAAEAAEGKVEVLVPEVLSDSDDDDFRYDELPAMDDLSMVGGDSPKGENFDMPPEMDFSNDGDEEDLLDLTSLEKTVAQGASAAQHLSSTATARMKERTDVRPCVVEDFIRNFLIKKKLFRS